jgi:hypothetical protein
LVFLGRLSSHGRCRSWHRWRFWVSGHAATQHLCPTRVISTPG